MTVKNLTPAQDPASTQTSRAMLTTVDNPYSPFTEFDAWFAFDSVNGYNTCGLLARITFTSEELSEADQERALQQAMDEIIEFNASGMHKKVYRSP